MREVPSGATPTYRPRAGEGDGDRVDRPFHDDRDLTAGEVVAAEQLGAFVEQRGFGGVEVFRSGEGGVGGVGVASADEPEHLSVVVGDGEDDPVAEAVDESAGAGGGGDPGGEHLLVGDAAAVEVVDQPGPAGRGLAGPEPGVAGQVLPHPVAR